MRALAKLVLLLLAIGVAGIAAWSAGTAWHPPDARYAFQGVDVSEAQGSIEWSGVAAAGASFAYVVATTGADRRDAQFEANWQGADDAGLRRGALHRYSLCQPAADQANAFDLVVPKTTDALPAAVEVAFTNDCTARPERAALVADLTRFVASAETHTGKPLLLKVTRAVERRYRLSEAIARPIWAVGDLIKPNYATRPWRMWQASHWRRVDGVTGPVDWDVVAP